MRLKNLLTFCVLAAGGILLFVHLALVFHVNISLTQGRFALHMDERITFDEVTRILTAVSADDLIDRLIIGDQRYGRLYFVLSAIASALPRAFLGDAGTIIATRLFLAACLLGAYAILACVLLKSWRYRIFALIGMTLLPWTLYYETMPKPEPVGLLLLALSIRIALRSRVADIAIPLGLLIGLACGTKISFVPPGLTFLAIALMRSRSSPDGDWSAWPKCLLACIAGWLIAAPVVMLGHYPIYESSILANVTHGSDQSDTGISEWAGFYFHYYLRESIVMLLVLGGVAALFTATRSWREPRGVLAIEIVLIGLSASLPVAIGINRLWGFYLHVGSVFLILGFFIGLEHLTEKFRRNRVIHAGLLLALILSGVCLFVPQFRGQADEAKVLASRDSDDRFFRQLRTKNALEAFFNTQSSESPLLIYQDPRLFPLEQPGHQLKPFWGPFLLWEQNPDYIIFEDTSCWYDPSHLPPVSSRSYHDCVIARKLFLDHLSHRDGGQCFTGDCYELRLYLEGTGILERAVRSTSGE